MKLRRYRKAETVRWEMFQYEPEKIEALLLDGWKPFAVSDAKLYLRKRTRRKLA